MCLKNHSYKSFSRVLLSCSLFFCVGLSCNRAADREEQTELVQTGPEIIYVTDPDGVLQGPVLSLPKQIVNIKGGGLLFIQVAVQYVELNRPQNEESIQVKFMDDILSVASLYDESTLRTSSGKEKFRLELVSRFSAILGDEARIANLYFQEFLIR